MLSYVDNFTKDASLVASNILKIAIKTKNELNIEIPVSASIGVYKYTKGNKCNIDLIISAADELLYKSKLAGKDCYTLSK